MAGCPHPKIEICGLLLRFGDLFLSEVALRHAQAVVAVVEVAGPLDAKHGLVRGLFGDSAGAAMRSPVAFSN